MLKHVGKKQRVSQEPSAIKGPHLDSGDTSSTAHSSYDETFQESIETKIGKYDQSPNQTVQTVASDATDEQMPVASKAHLSGTPQRNGHPYEAAAAEEAAAAQAQQELVQEIEEEERIKQGMEEKQKGKKAKRKKKKQAAKARQAAKITQSTYTNGNTIGGADDDDSGEHVNCEDSMGGRLVLTLTKKANLEPKPYTPDKSHRPFGFERQQDNHEPAEISTPRFVCIATSPNSLVGLERDPEDLSCGTSSDTSSTPDHVNPDSSPGPGIPRQRSPLRSPGKTYSERLSKNGNVSIQEETEIWLEDEWGDLNNEILAHLAI